LIFFAVIQNTGKHPCIGCQSQKLGGKKQSFEFQAGNQVPKFGALNMKRFNRLNNLENKISIHISSFNSCNMPKSPASAPEGLLQALR